MNWYRIFKFGSNFVKLPDNIDEQINEVAREAVKYYFYNKNKEEIIGKFTFINPYTKNSDYIYVVSWSFTLDQKDAIAAFNPQNRIMSIFPYHHKINNVNTMSLFHYIKENLYHEVTHMVDPKFLIKDWWRGRQNINYLSREEEFDGYSRQIEFIIKTNLNEKNIEDFINWLRTDNINLLSKLLSQNKDIEDVILYWRTNKSIYYKKLKQRLYNSFVKGEIYNAIRKIPEKRNI